jgi:acetoin utilization deacetylase AcuC-like enzyme/GNAT superfamily N-acetyltransferase
MFRIRRIHDDVLPVNQEAIRQVQAILHAQFASVPAREIEALRKHLRDPLTARFRTILLVAEDARGVVQGFAIPQYAPDLGFCFLDYIAARPEMEGRGVGGALYRGVREEAAFLGARAVLFECLPDDPTLSPDPAIRSQNEQRLRFYEGFGARPIAGTRYETPLKPDTTDPPYLVADLLDRDAVLRRDEARAMVRAILDRKYAGVCPPGYVDMVVESFRDDPVLLRPYRYRRAAPAAAAVTATPADRRIVLVVSDQHENHHVRERGYVEAPVRIRTILRELEHLSIFERRPPRAFSDRHILAVHDAGFVTYLRRVCSRVGRDDSVYPYVFPIRNAARPPRELAVRAGYYCIDTFTPLNRDAYTAARRAVDCALTGADALLRGVQVAYALVRPPGHHAERRSFGGFCYFNSAAIAAQHLSRIGPVAMLDVDYHHGNGQQDIFWHRGDVLTVSIHGHPRFAYPYFSGFDDERGDGDGRGANLNIPLGEEVDGEAYRVALGRAVRRIERFRPRFLVVALGLDTARGDPTGTWSLRARDFEANGRIIAALRLPTLVIQEGGYDSRVLGVNARHFFLGLWKGRAGA